ncbi:MAG: hypothetical protein ACRD3E_04050 [Terriglobales bacterium]
MNLGRTIRAFAVAAMAVATISSIAVAADDSASLDSGYESMYNLQFDAAHTLFHQWEQQHPADPMGPVSDAAAYLFDEFNQLHVLQIELFTDDKTFEGRPVPPADPKLKQAFDAQLDRATQLANAALQRNPNDANALFASTLAFGLRGDYLAMIEKRELAGLSYIKQGRALAERLIASDPSCYDAYLAIGVENYLLSLKPAPVRWFLRLGGAETDKESGLQKLRVTAEKGHFLRSYARLLLAVAALRDHENNKARSLLSALAQRYPRNPLYGEELARVQ